MGKQGSGKELLSSSVPHGLAEYIRLRGERLHKNRAWALRQIIQWWLDSGAPPLSHIDAKLDPLPVPEYLLSVKALPIAAEAKALYQASKDEKRPGKKP